MKRKISLLVTALLTALLLLTGAGNALADPISGAIFTTDGSCTGTNVNIFSNKEAVYLDGGPRHPEAAGLPDGDYYVQVTAPNGNPLGFSKTAVVKVTNGSFEECYNLYDILYTASSGYTAQGYDNTPNTGGVYKVWVSMYSNFPPDESKTDNFKVLADNTTTATLQVIKFYDANANGINDDGIPITGWKINITDGNYDLDRYTPVSIELTPGTYTVSEYMPLEYHWVATTPNQVTMVLDGDDETVEFGNVCIGTGGGHTLGFWSNKNGQAAMNDGGNMADELALLAALNLRNAAGGDFDPANYSQFRAWLLDARATNMAYMLSAQLAAMELNVEAGFVSGGALVYAPELLPFMPAGLNSLGFISINDLTAAADAELWLHGYTPAGNADRAYQEALKNALDKANNNMTFVQASPCLFSFE